MGGRGSRCPSKNGCGVAEADRGALRSHVDEASLTPGAFVRNETTVVYPAPDTQPE